MKIMTMSKPKPTLEKIRSAKRRLGVTILMSVVIRESVKIFILFTGQQRWFLQFPSDVLIINADNLAQKTENKGVNSQ